MFERSWTQCKIVNSKKHEMVCFLDSDKVKLGLFVTLSDSVDSIEWWKIVEIYQTLKENNIKGGHNSKNWYKKDYLYKIGNKK